MDITTKTSILDMDATAIAQAIDKQTISSVEAVSAYIEHIKKINPLINAMVEERFEQALLEANKADEQVGTGKPLHGVPISVKESYHVAGMKTTSGLIHRQDLVEKNDAEIVKKLKAAGAIVLGKTNTPTLCFCQETDNKLYGRTNNAWDVSRTAGGSSGGEGALLAAGGAAVGIGSDIGGSIRFPSHFNGVIGFKPGKHQVSQQGHFPHNEIALQERMLGLGPMGKSVRDMELVYSLIANDPPQKQSLDSFAIEMLPIHSQYPLSAKSKEIFHKIKRKLTDDFPVREMAPPHFEESALLWQEIMSVDGGESVKKHAFVTDRPNVIIEFLKEKTGFHSQVHPYLSWALIGAKLFQPGKKRIAEIEQTIDDGDRHLQAYLNKRLLLFPVYHTGAPLHGTVFAEIFSIRKTFLKYMPYIAYANVWGLPSLTIPVGVDEYNMPIGVQIMSINGNEDAIFTLGKWLEKEFRGFKRSAIGDA